MPKATISKVTFKKEIVHQQYGTTNVYKIELSDGIKGDMMRKPKDGVPTSGDEIEYEYEPNAVEHFDGKIKEIKAKPFKNFGGGGKKSEKAENARTALIVAKDLIIAGKSKEGLTTKEIADWLFAWLESKLD